MVTRRKRWNGNQIGNLSQTAAESPAGTCNHPAEQSAKTDVIVERWRNDLAKRPTSRRSHRPPTLKSNGLWVTSRHWFPLDFDSMTGTHADHRLQDVGRLSWISGNLEIPLSNAMILTSIALRNWLGLRLDYNTELYDNIFQKPLVQIINDIM